MPKKFLICLVLFFVGMGRGGAQDTANPFELIYRLEKGSIDTVNLTHENPFEVETSREIIPKEEQKAQEMESAFEVETPGEVIPEGKQKVQKTENPFDISSPAAAGSKVAPPPKEKRKRPALPKREPLPDRMVAPAFIFWFLGAVLLFLTISITAFRNHLTQAYKAFTNENFLKLLFRQQPTFLSFPFVVFYLLFFINAGFFLFLSGQKWGVLSSPGTIFSILLITGVVMLAFFLKHLCLSILESVFPIEKVLGQYSFTIVIFGIILGIILVPFNIVIPYVSPGLSTVVLAAGWISICLVYLVRIVRSLFLASKIIFFHKSHFFIYLCTIEIAPFIVVIKLIYSI